MFEVNVLQTVYVFHTRDSVCFVRSTVALTLCLVPGGKGVASASHLTIEAETVLDGGVGRRRRRRKRQGEGLQGGTHNTH